MKINKNITLRFLFMFVIAVSLCHCATLRGSEYKPVAKVNNEEVTFKNVQDEFESKHSGHSGFLMLEEGFVKYLNRVIDKRLLIQEGYRVGLNEDEEILNLVQEYKSKLKEDGVGRREREEKGNKFEESLVIERLYSEKIITGLKVSEEEAMQYYDSHHEKFTRPEMFNVSQIVVKDEERANEVHSELKKGAKFARLARKFSIDVTAKSGGEIGWITEGKIIPELKEAIITLYDGEISKPVKTKFGFHIIKMNEKRESQLLDFPHVSQIAYSKALAVKQKEALDEWIQKLREGSTIEIYNDAIKENLEKVQKNKGVEKREGH